MKEFMLLVRNQIDHQANWSTEQHARFLEKCGKYIDGLTQGGKLISAQPLIREGRMVYGTKGAWKEGDFHETNEVIVGYYHIFAGDMNEAMEIAKGNPEYEYGTTARIEVRPVKAKEESTNYVYPKEKR